jgi:hypothetical protein
MTGQLNLSEQTRGAKFGVKADKIYEKAIAQARAVFAKTKLSDLV